MFMKSAMLSLMLGVIVPGGPVTAQTTEWLGGSGVSWDTPANWSDGVPDADTDVLIAGSPGPVVDGIAAVARDILYVDPNGDALIVRNGGTLECRDLVWQVDFVGGGVAPVFTVQNTGSALFVSGDLILGREQGQAPTTSLIISRLRVHDGGSIEVAGELFLGMEQPATGEPIWGSQLEIAGEGSHVKAGTMRAAYLAETNFHLNQGGRLEVEGDFLIGSPSGTNPPPRGPARILIGSSPSTGASLEPGIIDAKQGITGQSAQYALIRFTHNDDEYHFSTLAGQPLLLSGGMQLEQRGAGTTVLGAQSTFTGPTRVEQGTLIVEGGITGSDVEVEWESTLRGSGAVGPTINRGTIRPGFKATGTLDVDGDYLQEVSGSVVIRVRPDGTADRLDVVGGATFLGGTLVIDVEAGDHAPGSEFVIVSAAQGFTGLPTIVQENATDMTLEVLTLTDEIRVTLLASGSLEVEPGTVEFGQVAVGDTAAHSVTLRNAGQANLLVHEVSDAQPPFERTGGTCPAGFAFVLQPDATCEIEFSFAPLVPGTAEETVIIDHDGLKGAFDLLLMGEGGEGADPEPDIFIDRFEVSMP